ncbi:bifunctional DNA-formamidopyrimidine glycosylase/DNA-(apurinic or apyrimidinic site) lyase [Pseudohaliea rubra]|uniref:bifunctional DNA-formamidopyrimidine glycosylase/DNA-(apurinic or apyrimidinic site) lyase n=1 Tax=Pseudohaliea rubra TaxID=475795 RepID=UPI00054F0F63|nr:bifunctional DNA-formamidopyrimidine glycosylase/DNA-(apurinic or apyrimidinic site) lyase [Pseudohaliea rubra]
MPELPEVETTRRGLAPHAVGERVLAVTVREPRLRWPVDPALPAALAGQRIEAIDRRAKYLLLRTGAGRLMVHLGMSGSLRVLPAGTAPAAHDHIDIVLGSGLVLRYNDPRRFGSFHWLPGDDDHPLLAHLGPEPLGDGFDGTYLYRLSRGRRAPVKVFIMDARVVVGVGNIYAAESLFLAGITPRRPAGRIAAARYSALAGHIRAVLTAAIAQGGTTLRDFVGTDGRPGYFAQQLWVYGRGGESCRRCGAPLRECRIAQRASVYCVACQR